MRREIPVEESIGMVLAHDLTQIIPGQFKGRLFKKGHIIREEDIPALLSIGKRHIYALIPEEGEVHEDDAAQAMARLLADPSLAPVGPHEGKVTLKAAWNGLLTIDADRLKSVNRIGELAIVTKRSAAAVTAGETVAGLRALPLLVDRRKLDQFSDIIKGSPLLRVLPFLRLKVGVVTTGSEVFSGLIEDRFGPVLRDKLQPYGLQWLGQSIVGDELDDIVAAIRSWLAAGADLVLVTGGMSVDPDDRSPGAIRQVADRVVAQGMPVLPGSMTMLAYAGEATLMGLPGCVIYDSVTAFDWLLPRIAAGQRPTADDIAELGHGGLMGNNG